MVSEVMFTCNETNKAQYFTSCDLDDVIKLSALGREISLILITLPDSLTKQLEGAE